MFHLEWSDFPLQLWNPFIAGMLIHPPFIGYAQEDLTYRRGIKQSHRRLGEKPPAYSEYTPRIVLPESFPESTSQITFGRHGPVLPTLHRDTEYNNDSWGWPSCIELLLPSCTHFTEIMPFTCSFMKDNCSHRVENTLSTCYTATIKASSQIFIAGRQLHRTHQVPEQREGSV